MIVNNISLSTFTVRIYADMLYGEQYDFQLFDIENTISTLYAGIPTTVKETNIENIFLISNLLGLRIWHDGNNVFTNYSPTCSVVISNENGKILFNCTQNYISYLSYDFSDACIDISSLSSLNILFNLNF